ncbi:MAG TPA: hypothetical protein VFZ21_31805 [Gemmatimonadaceae bacterium]|nr:hypothetical protein [Gemmatimonadaceae bacterium]
MSLELGGRVTIGTFTPGLDRVYAFTLMEPLELTGVPRSWSGPVSNDMAPARPGTNGPVNVLTIVEMSTGSVNVGDVQN